MALKEREFCLKRRLTRDILPFFYLGAEFLDNSQETLIHINFICLTGRVTGQFLTVLFWFEETLF